MTAFIQTYYARGSSQISTKKMTEQVTVLCNNLDPPLTSLYFARKMENRCSNLLKHAPKYL